MNRRDRTAGILRNKDRFDKLSPQHQNSNTNARKMIDFIFSGRANASQRHLGCHKGIHYANNYLRYRDDWSSLLRNQNCDEFARLTRYIISKLTDYNITLVCEDHIHTFLCHEEGDSSHPVIFNQNTTLHSTTCWEKTMTQLINNVIIRLPTPTLTPALTDILTHINLDNEVEYHQFHQLYQTIERVWHNLESENIPYPRMDREQKHIEIIKVRYNNPSWRTLPKLLCRNITIYQDHQFHIFIAKTDDMVAIFQFLNNTRRPIGSDPLLLQTLLEYMKKCPKCRMLSGQTLKQAIYYFPSPTTQPFLQDQIIAFNTTWLHSDIQYEDLLPIIRTGAGIITDNLNIYRQSLLPQVDLTVSSRTCSQLSKQEANHFFIEKQIHAILQDRLVRKFFSIQTIYPRYNCNETLTRFRSYAETVALVIDS